MESVTDETLMGKNEPEGRSQTLKIFLWCFLVEPFWE